MTRVLINIDVDDMDRAIRFYEAALGLTVGRRLGSGVVEMLGAEAPIYLLYKPEGTRVSRASAQRRSYRRHWTPVHLDVVVEDLDMAVARAEGAGAQLEQPASRYSWGRLALMADPFGHGFCLVEFVGDGYHSDAGS